MQVLDGDADESSLCSLSFSHEANLCFFPFKLLIANSIGVVLYLVGLQDSDLFFHISKMVDWIEIKLFEHVYIIIMHLLIEKFPSMNAQISRKSKNL